MSFVTRPKLKRWLLRLVLDEQPSRVYVSLPARITGSTSMGRFGAFLDITGPLFAEMDRGLRERALSVARRDNGMPPERLISKLFRGHMERTGRAVLHLVCVPTSPELELARAKADSAERKAREDQDALPESQRRPVFACRGHTPWGKV